MQTGPNSGSLFEESILNKLGRSSFLQSQDLSELVTFSVFHTQEMIFNMQMIVFHLFLSVKAFSFIINFLAESCESWLGDQ